MLPLDDVNAKFVLDWRRADEAREAVAERGLQSRVTGRKPGCADDGPGGPRRLRDGARDAAFGVGELESRRREGRCRGAKRQRPLEGVAEIDDVGGCGGRRACERVLEVLDDS